MGSWGELMRQKPGGRKPGSADEAEAAGGELGSADKAEAVGGGCGSEKARAVCKDRRASLWGEGKRESFHGRGRVFQTFPTP